MRILIAAFILWGASFVKANTFVGNGGNPGDVEMQVTLIQIRMSLTDIIQKKYTPKQLCTCDESMEGHKICNALRALTVEQRLYCESSLVSHAQEMLNIINGRAGVQIIWTNEAMQVSEALGEREAIGVSQPQEKKIILNRENFLDLRDYERIYLMTHELGHLVKMEGRFLRDDEKIGPFKQDDGGRQFLNSLGAGVAMKSLTNDGIDDYKGSLRRSKNYKKNWLNVSLISEASHDDKSTFAIKDYTGVSTSYRFQVTQELGLSLGFRTVKGEGTFLGSVRAENSLQLYNVQLNYRLFPFSNPLTFWGQSHAVLSAGYEAGQAHMKLADNYTSATDDANLSAGTISAQYYIPMLVGIWFNGGVNYSNLQYEYKTIGFKSQNNQAYFNLGVSYAF